MTQESSTPNGRRDRVQVLIVGSGPSGGTSALLLGQMGISCIVLSKHRGTANTPRAHIFNQRAMEALRDAGLEPRLSKHASPATAMMHTSWLNSLMGEEYGRIYAWGNKPELKGEYELASPTPMSDLPQSELEPILVEEAAKLGAEFRFGHVFESLVQSGSGVSSTIRERDTDEVYTIDSDYVIGADGGRSLVLESLGLPIIGQQLNNAFNVHIKADLTHLFSHRPGSLNWILNNDAKDWSAVGNFRMVKPWTEFVVSMHPSLRDGSAFEPSTEDILTRLHQLIGDVDLDPSDQIKIEILSAYRWTINDQVAPNWQVDRVLCIGDAVHRHPPINGLGSNTCIGDAFNLSWKLAYVIKGLASSELLETLTQERAPVGRAIVARANEGMRDHRELWGLLGLTTEERETTMTMMAREDEVGLDMRRKVQAAFEKTEDEVCAIGIQMNQIYAGTNSRLVVDESKSKLSTKGGGSSIASPLKSVIVSTEAGYHLPHVWVVKDGQSPRLSTLDICGKGQFTLITGIGGSKWKEAVRVLSDRGFPIRSVSIGFRQDYHDAYGNWARVKAVKDEGAILVRPDHFVMWRSNECPAEPLEVLKDVLKSGLGFTA